MTQAARTLYSMDEIGDASRARILDLCRAWDLDGHYDQASREFIALNPLRADRSLGSFRVVCEGEKQGLIKDFATGQAWSPIGFTADLWFGGRTADAVAWMKRFLGFDGGDPNAIAKTRRAVVAKKEVAEVSDLDKSKRGHAHGLYVYGATPLYGVKDEAKGKLLDTPVLRYLRGRGIDLARFPGKVKALRLHPDLHHVPSCWCKGDYQAKGQHVHYPAMLAPIIAADGETFLGLHRTFLQAQGELVKKAPVGKDAKLCLGRYAGGMIRLWRGVNVNPETGVVTMRARLGDMEKRLELGRGEKVELHLAEGIEDALTVAQRFPEFTVAAGVSISNMTRLDYPPAVGRVVLWRDNDVAGAEADKAFAKVVANAQRQGLTVKVVRPPLDFKDANEVLQHQLREGAA